MLGFKSKSSKSTVLLPTTLANRFTNAGLRRCIREKRGLESILPKFKCWLWCLLTSSMSICKSLTCCQPCLFLICKRDQQCLPGSIMCRLRPDLHILKLLLTAGQRETGTVSYICHFNKKHRLADFNRDSPTGHLEPELVSVPPNRVVAEGHDCLSSSLAFSGEAVSLIIGQLPCLWTDINRTQMSLFQFIIIILLMGAPVCLSSRLA